MKTRLTWLLILMLALTAFWGCSDDDGDDPGTPTETAFETMAAAGAAYINDSVDCPGVINATVLNDNLDLYTVIDIRSEASYLAGHIPGAFNSSLGTLVADLASKSIPTGKPYVVACYSGQSAGHAKIAMEMLGYSDVSSLLWGMSSWNSTLDSWSGNTGDNLPTAETDNNNGDLIVETFPTLSEDVETVVVDRTEITLQGGFKGKSFAEIEDYLDDYFIINYFSEADYLGQGSSGVPGHIPGAFQFTPYASLGIEEMLPNIPTDKPVIVYCWTGQHSSQVTFYLNMLGYEAYSLKFGSNNLFHSDLTAHKWSSAQQNDFALEMGHAPGDAFDTIAAALVDYVNDSTDCPGVLSASDLNDNLDLYTVIDIRSETDFDAGHIDGAHHSSLATLMDDVGTDIPTDKPFVIACYTGQSAGHAKIAMEMAGYEDTKSLLFGMSSWNTTLDSWTGNCADNLGTVETDNNNADLTWHVYPDLTGQDLDGRVDVMLAGGFKGKSYTEIEDYLDDYFVINYFSEADYLGEGESGVPGHIPGAFQFTPYASLGVDEMLGNLPTDMPIIVYCWTGQHSSQVTAYLNMLGYEAYSLKFGSNGLFHTDLTAHKWTSSAQNDFDLVPTPVLVANY